MIRNWKKAAAVIGALAMTAMVLPALSSPASAAILKPGISSGNGVTPAVTNGFGGCSTGTPFLWNGKSPGTQSPQPGVSITLTPSAGPLPGTDSRYIDFQITGAKMVQAIVKTDVFFVGFITESTVYSYASGVTSDTKIHPPTTSNGWPYKVDGYRFCYEAKTADLSITKAANTASQDRGGAVTYTLTVANDGPDDATGVTVTDTLPEDVTFVSASDGVSPAGDVVTWGGLTVPANGSIFLTVVVNVDVDAPAGATLTNSATVAAGNEIDTNPGNNSAISDVTVNNQPPIADFTFGVDLLDVQFTDESSDLDGNIESWAWDFGDGTTSTAEDPPLKSYEFPGTYDVKLTVTDNAGGTGSITQPVEVRFEEAVFCSAPEVVATTTGSAAQAATFTRGDNNNGDGGVTQNGCEDIGVTLQIDDEGVFLDKGTVGINSGNAQDVNSTLSIDWTPLLTTSPTLTDDLDREINFFPGEGGTFDIFVPVQWCLSSVDVELNGIETLTAVHPPAQGVLAGAGFTDGEVPWCLVSNTETLNADGTISQVQLYHGKGDPRMR